jgi:hypothetical protein
MFQERITMSTEVINIFEMIKRRVVLKAGSLKVFHITPVAKKA